MMKVATMDMLYVAADFLFANSTKGERESIFKMIEEGRKAGFFVTYNHLIDVL